MHEHTEPKIFCQNSPDRQEMVDEQNALQGGKKKKIEEKCTVSLNFTRKGFGGELR